MGGVERKYKVFRRGGRRGFVCRWFDDETARWCEKTIKATNRSDAERLAVKHLKSLCTERNAFSPQTFLGFRAKYEAEKGPAIPAAIIVWKSAANQLEKLVGPDLLADITPATLSTYEAGLRAAGCAEASIVTYLRAIRAALNWAELIGLVEKAPRVRIPRHSGNRRARGRAVTGEEFDRWLVQLSNVVGKARYDSWEGFVRGLYLSGLRLSESLDLWWDRDDKILVLNLEGQRPVLQIPSQLHKARRNTVCPMAPEFAEFLRKTPHGKRSGPVFSPLDKRLEPNRSGDYCGRVVSLAGQKAKIVVSRDGEQINYATAHDLRRTFGLRWALRVMPAVLKELMRHRTIDTTMEYYAVQSAEHATDVLWRAVTTPGDKPGDMKPARKKPTSA